MLKNAIDRSLAAAALLILSPGLCLLFWLIRRRMGRPALFRQVRIGCRERPFTLFKLRTMTDARDAQGRLLPDARRLTPLGHFLRRTSLDELPQLWNVLRGDMALVGPRPLLPEYLSRYDARQRRRHDVKPGLTGWAQINGRNALSWEEKFDLDIWYVEHRGLWLDIRILGKTFLRVIQREGISESGTATMSEFMGNAASSATAGNHE